MIVVEMNEDIRKKTVKVLGSFTFRQIICLIIGSSYAIPLGIALPTDITIKIIVPMLSALPVIACGWVKMDGQYFETIAIRWIYKHFLTPSKRKKKDMEYVLLRKQLKKEKEREKINAMPKRQRDAYKKAHKNGPVIKYSQKASNKMYR